MNSIAKLIVKHSRFIAFLGAGLAQGYIEMADKFETGTKATRSNPAVFRNQMSEYRRQARAVAMQVVEVAHQHMNKWKDPNVTFVLPFPAGSVEEAAGSGQAQTLPGDQHPPRR